MRNPVFQGRCSPAFVVVLATALLALALLGVALHQQGPGYTDEAYYAAAARHWAEGHGFELPFLWVYLGDPPGLPHPGFDYWMPLSALLAGAAARLTAGFPWPYLYLGMKLPFFFLVLSLPLLTLALYRQLAPRARATAVWPAFLPLTAAFFLPYLLAVDAFTPLMVLGGLYFLLFPQTERPVWATLLGLVTAAVHLARAEGPLWLGVALAWAWHRGGRRSAGLLLGGYVLGMAPWWWRNLQAFGSPFPPGAYRVLWLTRYEDLFLYPARNLTPARWLAAGPQAWLWPRIHALAQNLRTLLAVQSAGVWLPWLLWGAMRLRHHPVLRFGFALEAGLFILMSLVFPFPGPRGAFFHALAGLQPLAWATAAVGLEAFLHWGGRVRGWPPNQARRILIPALVLLGVAAAWIPSRNRLRTWNQPWQNYQQLARQLLDRSILPAAPCPVMLNDPAMWYWAVRHPALTLPAGGPQAVTAAAARYHVCLLLVEPNHPVGMRELYTHPHAFGPFRYLGTVARVRVFLPQQ